MIGPPRRRRNEGHQSSNFRRFAVSVEDLVYRRPPRGLELGAFGIGHGQDKLSRSAVCCSWRAGDSAALVRCMVLHLARPLAAITHGASH